MSLETLELGQGPRLPAPLASGPCVAAVSPARVQHTSSCLESEAGEELGMSSELNQPNKYVLGQGKEDRCDYGSPGCRTEEME